MLDNLEKINETLFEDIKHIDEYGNEYWFARELMPVLEYDKWNNFHSVMRLFFHFHFFSARLLRYSKVPLQIAFATLF